MFKVISSKRPEIEMWHIFNLYSEKHPKTACDHQIIALFQEIWIAESNGDVRILT